MIYLKKIKRSCLLIALVLVWISPSPLGASNHETLVEAAKKEGALVFYTSMTVGQAQDIHSATFRTGEGMLFRPLPAGRFGCVTTPTTGFASFRRCSRETAAASGVPMNTMGHD